jgi:hypothetical protein
MSRCDQGVVLHGYDRVVPFQDFFPDEPLLGSSRLRLPNVSYKQHLPFGWRRQRRDLRAAGLR